MNQIQKRFILFLGACIVVRLLFVIIARYIAINNIKYLPYLGYIGLIIGFSFLYIFITDSRKTGFEVFGDKIWWNKLRPVHALLYLLFAYSAIIQKSKKSWIYLLVDVIIGLIGFLLFHYMNGDYKKL